MPARIFVLPAPRTDCGRMICTPAAAAPKGQGVQQQVEDPCDRQHIKKMMRRFPETQFIVWTGAAQVRGATAEANAVHARRFFDWVKENWDEQGDNIYIWDFCMAMVIF